MPSSPASDPSDYLRLVDAAERKSADNDWAAAGELWEQVVAQNPVNGNHWDRLAEALYGSGDFAGALRAYQQVQQLGVSRRLSVSDSTLPGEVAYRLACCYANLGDEERAIDGLATALSGGFRDLKRPRQDELWRALRADPRVRQLLGVVEAEAMSREEGWRTDVEFFARELKRRAYSPWRAIGEAEFDAAVSTLVAHVGEFSDAQILARLLSLLRRLEDGHASIGPGPKADLNLALPLKFYVFEEGTFVVSSAPVHAQLLGSQLLAVGGHDLASVWAALDPVISRDNAQQVKRMAPELLRWSPLLHALGLSDDPGEIALGLRSTAGADTVVTVAAVPISGPEYPDIDRPHQPLSPRPEGWASLPVTSSELPLYLRNSEVPYWFEHLAEHRLVYLQFNEVRDDPAEPFAQFCDRVFGYIDRHDVDRLVIDLRWNGGGNTLLGLALLRHLIGHPKVDQWGNLFVVIGRATFSAAQNTATAIEKYTRAVFVGEPTGSRPNFIGESAPFELPYSKTQVNVSDLYWQTSWPADNRPWVPPEIYAPPTFAAYRENRDPALEAVLSAQLV